MKRLIIILMFLQAMTGCSFAQETANDQLAELQSTLETYKKISLARDVEGLLSFHHPGLFTQVPIEQMRKMMTQALADGKAPAIKSIEFEVISPVRPYSRGIFALVNSSRELTMQRPGDVTPEIDGLMIDLIKKRMGNEVETVIDEAKNVILISKKSSMLGVRQEGQGWKFIDQQRLGFFFENKLLPDDLKGQLK